MIYLLHFGAAIAHARHYIGFVEKHENLGPRMKKHEAGSGSKLMAAVSKSGHGFVIARLWEDGTRDQERRLKNRKEGPMLCPICNPKALNMAKDLTAPKRLTGMNYEKLKELVPCDGITVAVVESKQETDDENLGDQIRTD